MTEPLLTLRLLDEKFGICRLNKDEHLPEWAASGNFYSVTKTMDELSVVCVQDSIPSGIKCEKDWRAFKVEGPLDFSLIGILSSLSTILAQNKISIFAISTYDTDYILVKDTDTTHAIHALSDHKCVVKTNCQQCT